MRIRLQILLAVLPIFLGLGLVAGLLNHATRSQEMISGFREEAFTLAVSLSEFLGTDEGRRLAQGPDAGNEILLASLRRALQRNPIERLILTGTESHESWSLAKVDDEARPHLTEVSRSVKGVEQHLLGQKSDMRGGVLISEIVESGHRGPVLQAAVPVVDERGSFAILILDIDGRELETKTRAVRLESLLLIGAALMVGILISLLISRLVTGSIRELNKATEEVASGRYDWRIKAGWLREINDLSNTFNTMSSVLEEILSRAKRSMIEGEQFRSQSDLARAFARRLWNTSRARMGGVELAIARIGERPDGDLLGVWEQSDHIRVVMGRVLAAGELESVIMGSAALTLALQELTQSPTGHGFSLAGRIFEFESWDSLSWMRGSTRIDSWSYRAATGEVKRTISLQRNRPVALHNLPQDAAQRVELYLEVFRSLKAGHLMKELAFAFDEPAQGGLVIVSAN